MKQETQKSIISHETMSPSGEKAILERSILLQSSSLPLHHHHLLHRDNSDLRDKKKKKGRYEERENVKCLFNLNSK